jgi:hypothetical protein
MGVVWVPTGANWCQRVRFDLQESEPFLRQAEGLVANAVWFGGSLRLLRLGGAVLGAKLVELAFDAALGEADHGLCDGVGPRGEGQ